MTETAAEPRTVLVTACEAALYHCTEPEENLLPRLLKQVSCYYRHRWVRQIVLLTWLSWVVCHRVGAGTEQGGDGGEVWEEMEDFCHEVST